MSTKRMFSWSKRQSNTEPYYRTGGLLPIEANETDTSNGFDVKTTPKAKRRRPSTLKIIPSDDTQYVFTPLSTPRNAALENAANSLQAALNDMLRSPAPMPLLSPDDTVIRTSASLEKPLPNRPRSASVSSTPELPELPGSLLLENQGFPLAITPVTARPTSQVTRRETHPPDQLFEDERYRLNPLGLAPAPLVHTKSVPDLSFRSSTMRSSRGGNALKPIHSSAQHKKSLSETNARRSSRPNIITSPSSAGSNPTRSSDSTIKHNDNNNTGWRSLEPALPISERRTYDIDSESHPSYRNQLGTYPTPTPTTTRSKRIEELNATISTQDQTIITLQTQFGNLRASHEAHITSITESHSAEVASLKNYVQLLEEQARKPNLHHASSNNFLCLLDTTEPPQTPTRESSQNTVGPDSASTIAASPTALDKQQQSPRWAQNSPEMENFKRKLSITRRPESTNRNLLPELNQYKQNNAALQKQIESLMTKLNDSKRNEKDLRNTLGAAEQKCAELEDIVDQADKLAKTMQALQNTIDHLESRLEIANTERLDAEEQLSNLRDEKSPFGFPLPKTRMPSGTERSNMVIQDAHFSSSTVFSDPSPTDLEIEAEENSTLSAFVAHIERLQDQVKEKDAYIVELEDDRDELRERMTQLARERESFVLQSDIQNDLLRKSQRADTHIERLRAAVIDRESIIQEKVRALSAVEGQLEQHKLLLQAEIRRHAAMRLHATVEDDPLPELTSLAKKEDIDRWIDRLNERLRKEQGKDRRGDVTEASDSQAESLREEIDFYIREIIYFKLDIKGYKSDIRKLKKLTTRMSSYGSRASDLESETSSFPSGSRLALGTLDLRASNTNSSTIGGSVIAEEWFGTPSPSAPQPQSSRTSTTPTKPSDKFTSQQLRLDSPTIPQTSTDQDDSGVAGLNSNISTRAAAPQLPDPRTPTLPSPRRAKVGELMTSFPLSTPAIPLRPVVHKRSISEAALDLSSTPTESEWLMTERKDASLGSNSRAIVARGRSTSVSEAYKENIAPERPPRPPHGIFSILTLATGEQAENPPAPTSQGILSSRTGSVSSSTNNYATQPPPSPERRLSTASSSVLPFTVAISSTETTSDTTPAVPDLRSSSSITRYGSHQARTSTTRNGIGGTMTSKTPMDKLVFQSTTLTPEEKPAPTHKPSRKSKKQEDKLARVPSHSRSISACTIRTAIRLATKSSQEKERDKERKGEGALMKKESIKESISRPRPSDVGTRPVFEDRKFGGEPLLEKDEFERGRGYGYGYGDGVGEAM